MVLNKGKRILGIHLPANHAKRISINISSITIIIVFLNSFFIDRGVWGVILKGTRGETYRVRGHFSLSETELDAENTI